MSRSKLVSSIIKFVLVCSIIPGLVINVFAATQAGNGGNRYGGATVNTFAAGMPLTEVYFIANKFKAKPDVIEILDNTSGALKIDGRRVGLLDTALEHDKVDNDITGKYSATYKNAAILPDGTPADVIATMDIGRVMTGHVGNIDDIVIPTNIWIFDNDSSRGINVLAAVSNEQTLDGISFSIAVEQTVTLTISNGSGDFVVPINGINQNRNNAGSFKGLHEIHGEAGYNAAIETVTVPDNNVFYSTNNNNYITTESGQFTLRGGDIKYL